MHITWHFTTGDIAAVRQIVADHREHPIVRDRRTKNLKFPKDEVTAERFWKALTMALLTTQQPSGPTSAVTRLLATEPMPLEWERCKRERDLATFATRTLVEFGGIRRHGVIGGQLQENLNALQAGLWTEVHRRLEMLRLPAGQENEREVADFLQDRVHGLGPKQARNLLQTLGLTRYEVPIDSRVAKWLRELGFPAPTSASALSDRNFYHFVLDGFLRLCDAAGEIPCVVDGAVFASFDSGNWTPELLRF